MCEIGTTLSELRYMLRHLRRIKALTERIPFGGGCINDTIVHLATSHLPFGGMGESGIGSYHGKAGFNAFSHHKSLLHKSTRMDLDVRYQPYHAKKERMLRRFLK